MTTEQKYGSIKIVRLPPMTRRKDIVIFLDSRVSGTVLNKAKHCRGMFWVKLSAVRDCTELSWAQSRTVLSQASAPPPHSAESTLRPKASFNNDETKYWAYLNLGQHRIKVQRCLGQRSVKRTAMCPTFTNLVFSGALMTKAKSFCRKFEVCEG